MDGPNLIQQEKQRRARVRAERKQEWIKNMIIGGRTLQTNDQDQDKEKNEKHEKS